MSARDQLLDLLGFNSVDYAATTLDIAASVTGAVPPANDGYILTRGIDPFGRPVAFVFAGRTNFRDGNDDVWLDPAMLDGSVNAVLMRLGEVYPAYYTGLPTDLRDHLTDLAFNAWSANRGLWPVDSSHGARVQDEADLEQLAIWPKLYRRLMKYFADGNIGIAGFTDWLQAVGSRDDAVWIIPEARLGNLHHIVDVTVNNRISLGYFPEDVVIVPR